MTEFQSDERHGAVVRFVAYANRLTKALDGPVAVFDFDEKGRDYAAALSYRLQRIDETGKVMSAASYHMKVNGSGVDKFNKGDTRGKNVVIIDGESLGNPVAALKVVRHVKSKIDDYEIRDVKYFTVNPPRVYELDELERRLLEDIGDVVG